MISRDGEKRLCGEARLLFEEPASMVCADFGLSRPRRDGQQVLTFIDTEYLVAKAIVLLPELTMPEHRHPQRGKVPGKEIILEPKAQYTLPPGIPSLTTHTTNVTLTTIRGEP